MPPGDAPNVSASAGAITTANRSGARTGISSSRGVRTLRARRRRARRGDAPTSPLRRRSVARSVGVSQVDGVGEGGHGGSVGRRLVGSGGEARHAGEPEVDVIEGGRPAGDGRGAQPEPGDRGDGVAPERSCSGMWTVAPTANVVVPAMPCARERDTAPRTVAVDAQLEHLAARVRRAARPDSPGPRSDPRARSPPDRRAARPRRGSGS